MMVGLEKMSLSTLKRSMPLFDNSANHHRIATDDLNAKKLNLKYREKNMPILRDGFYKDQNGHRVVNTMLTAEGFQKGLKSIVLERGLS